jgi:ketosteroid isomerase-like protein
MTDFATAAERLIAAYNAKDFEAMTKMVAPDLNFCHNNRNFAFDNWAGLREVLQQFATALVPDRKFLPHMRLTASGNLIIREGFWTGTAQVDLPGFAQAGGTIMLKFCTILRFNGDGRVAEWTDYG